MVMAFRVEVVSPERVIYSGDADMVITRTLDGGEIAFQAGHAPFVGALVENHTRVFQTDGELINMAVHRGFVEVHSVDDQTKVTILSDEAELASEIDVEAVKAELERHEHTLRHEDGEKEIADALAGKARAQARLKASGYGFTA